MKSKTCKKRQGRKKRSIMFAGIAGFVERMIFMPFLFVPAIEAITAAATAFIGGAALGQRVCNAVEPSRREHP